MRPDQPAHLRHELDDVRVHRNASALERSIAPARIGWLRPRRTSWLLGVAVAAAAVVAAFAIAPARLDHGAARIAVPDTAAARTLVRAGNVAASEDWHPLASGEYSYSHVRTFGLQAAQRDMELWIGSGQARELEVNPVPQCAQMKDQRIGFNDLVYDAGAHPCAIREAASTTWSLIDMAAHLHFAVLVDGKVLRSPTSDSHRFTNVPLDVAQRQLWGTTTGEVAKVPAGGPSLEEGVRDIVRDAVDNSVARDWDVPSPERPARLLDGQVRMDAMIQMLGGAPISPQARQALFRLLAREPDATFVGTRRDRTGRRGTEIRFVQHFAKTLPEETISDRQFVRESIAAGVDADDVRDVVTTGAMVHRPERHVLAETTWTIIVDAKTGELLQSSRSGRSTVTGVIVRGQKYSTPSLSRQVPGGPLTLKVFPGAGGLGSGGRGGFTTVWLGRARTTDTGSRQPICAAHLNLCQDGAARA